MSELGSSNETTSEKIVRPPELTSLDEVLFEGSLDNDDSLTAESRFQWIVDALEHHLMFCPPYHNLAKGQGFSVSNLHSESDLPSVPLLSSGSFKRRLIHTETGTGVKNCTSSGTRGSQSLVPRDDRTLERFLGTVVYGLRSMIGLREARRVLVLGPTASEAGDLWFSYVLGLAELINDTSFFVNNGVLSSELLADKLLEKQDNMDTLLVGPPSLLVDFLDFFGRNRLNTHLDKTMILTAGGWKSRADEAIDREILDKMIEDKLGISKENVRDIFNMVELNTVIFECQEKRKHLPPWLDVTARQPSDLSVLPMGKSGLLAYLDPTALSYPGFILSDDFGYVDTGTCACGRHGRFMCIERRIARIEERGCALKMHSYTESTTQTQEPRYS